MDESIEYTATRRNTAPRLPRASTVAEPRKESMYSDIVSPAPEAKGRPAGGEEWGGQGGGACGVNGNPTPFVMRNA